LPWECRRLVVGLVEEIAEGGFYGFEPLPHRGAAVPNELIERLLEDELG
jgi:hypothetical protein